MNTTNNLLAFLIFPYVYKDLPFVKNTCTKGKSGHWRVVFQRLYRKKTFFQIPFHDDRIFTDDVWFRKPNIIPHVENHRPTIKKKIVQIKDN